MDMFDSLKKNINRRSIVAYIVFGAIILVFVFFGFKTTDDKQMGYAARVNNKLISINEYKAALDRVTYFSKMFGGGNSPDADTRNRIDALNQIIQLELISQGALQEGLTVTNPEIVDKIMSDETFKKDGIFQRDMYERALSYEGMSASSYEERLKKSMLYQKTFKLFENSILPSDFEIKKIQSLDKELVNVEFLKLEYGEVKGTKIDQSAFNEKVVEIEKLFSANPQEAINKATALGIKWTETGYFNLSTAVIPKIGNSSEMVLNAFKMQNKGEVARRIFSVMASKYIIRLKDRKTDSKVNEDSTRNFVGMRVQGIFQKWTQDLAQKNIIERNPAIIQISAD